MEQNASRIASLNESIKQAKEQRQNLISRVVSLDLDIQGMNREINMLRMTKIVVGS